jgi:hypothetical protein
MRWDARTLRITIGIVLLIVLTLFAILFHPRPPGFGTQTVNATYKDASYIVEGKVVSLRNGSAEEESAPGSSSKIVTKYFGNDAEGDVNGDGQEDTVFLLTRESGGSGTFYYVAAALKTASGYQGTNAIFLGDRIAPQSTEIQGAGITVNYAERLPGEPMSVPPHAAVSKRFMISGAALVEASK